MRLALALAVLAACGPQTPVFEPSTADFGEVDFSGELPDEGYAVASVALRNPGPGAVDISLAEYDTDRLCLIGFGTQDFPVELGELAADDTYAFFIGLCGYLPGELDTEVATELRVYSDPGIATLPITYTPIRSDE